jgi:uncharacterized protein (DUF427 family)
MPQSGYVARPDYRVELLCRRNLVVARAGETPLASSRRTILVDEQDHGLVFYFPAEDVAWDGLAPMAGRSTYCPFKGEADYFSLRSEPCDPIAWRHASPVVQVAAIAGHIAFYQDRIPVTVHSTESLGPVRSR